MTFHDHSMQTAYKMGAYKALAEMMRDKIRDIDSEDKFDREWAIKCLKMLAEQFDETVEKLEPQPTSLTA